MIENENTLSASGAPGETGRKKQVAIFLSALYEGMVRETVQGMLDGARDERVKLIFFVSFADNHTSKNYDLYQDYDIGDFVVYLLPDLHDYQALITLDTYMTGSFLAPMERLKKAAPCPVITMGTVKEGTCSIVNDQDHALTELIRHVIVHHGCRDIVHVTGPAERSFCRERIEIFRKTMEAYGLPCGEDRVIEGELRPECGPAVVEKILEMYARKGERKLPEAILCVNDYSAIGIIGALEKRGFHVPKDVIVTGYDDILRAQMNDPTITTSAQPFYQVGKTGMETTLRIMRGETVPSCVSVPGVLRLRQSCGCESRGDYAKYLIQEKYIRTVSNLESFMLSSTNLVLGGAIRDTLEEIYDEIEKACLRETKFRDAILCMIDGWDQNKTIQHRYTLKEETFNVVCGIWNGRPVKRLRLPKGQLLPDELMNDEKPCFIYPIHHLQYFLGYFVVNPDLQEMEQLHIKSWLVSVSTVLISWLFRHQLQTLSRTDTLTGLYNRRGYYQFFSSYYQECAEKGTELAVFLIDMNGMKSVNDHFGHEEGDYCLKVIANALRISSRHDEICVRTGGDEFVVLARHYDQAKEAAFIQSVRDEIRRQIQQNEKPYPIACSIGCYRSVPHRSGSVEIQEEADLFLRRADRSMYLEKKRNQPV